jgi:hypothetical protein
MARRTPIAFLGSAAVIPLAALASAACGGGVTAAMPKTSTGASTTVANSSLGNSTGRTPGEDSREGFVVRMTAVVRVAFAGFGMTTKRAP